jgi:hypothetical protein
MYKYKDKLLTEAEEKALFGYNALDGIPPEMAAWTLALDPPLVSENNPGQYVLVNAEPAWIEMHHQVEILDENGDPLPRVWVIFGFPASSEPVINLQPSRNRWSHSPAVLIGNAQRTNRMGYAQHTFGTGGEDIWVWDVQDGVLELPSPIIKSANWVGTEEGGPFIHTGVKLTFQRRREDVEPRGPRLDRIELAIQALEERIVALESGSGSDGQADNEVQTLLLENLKLKVELLETKVANLTA